MALRDTARGLLGGVQRFSNGVSGLLFPGMDATGVDPQLAQAARAQAMMQMGAGLLGGQNFGQAYGLGQQSGYEPIEQARREAAMRAATADRQAQAAELERRRKAEEASVAQQQRARELAAPYLQSGDYEGARRALLTAGLWDESKAMPNIRDESGAKIGAYNPGDYTPESFAKFVQGGMSDPAVLRRQYAPQQAPTPVIFQSPAYGAALVDRRTGQPIQQFTTPEQERAAIAGAATAKEQSAAGVTASKDAVDREAALRLYETAAEGLMSGLEGSRTGPIAGRIPAVTAAQQTAEGGVAAMAPVLKQLFRVAGEGVFTDRDQQLLIDMVPKRTDLPEARDAKLANIDKIVRAKLRAPEKAAAPAGSAFPAQQSTGAPVKIMGQADYDRLQSGDTYIAPDGTTRTKR